MRLGQLARKLSLRPSEITEFLAARNISIEEGANTKIDDDHVSLIIQQFAPGMEAAIVSEARLQEETKAEPVTIQEVVSTPQDVLPDTDVPEAAANVAQDNPEVIKAPKVELSGLKVLGKIELPETKKKATEESGDNAAAEEPIKKDFTERRQASPRKDMRGQRPSKNPIASEREREALEAKKKMEAEAERQKEKRTQNYLKKVKPGQPTKAVKIVQEETEQMSASELAERPKTLWGKLVRWFTT